MNSSKNKIIIGVGIFLVLAIAIYWLVSTGVIGKKSGDAVEILSGIRMSMKVLKDKPES